MSRVDLDGLGVKVEGFLVIFVSKGMAALRKQFLNGRHDSQKEKGMSDEGTIELRKLRNEWKLLSQLKSE